MQQGGDIEVGQTLSQRTGGVLIKVSSCQKVVFLCHFCVNFLLSCHALVVCKELSLESWANPQTSRSAEQEKQSNKSIIEYFCIIPFNMNQTWYWTCPQPSLNSCYLSWIKNRHTDFLNMNILKIPQFMLVLKQPYCRFFFLS